MIGIRLFNTHRRYRIRRSETLRTAKRVLQGERQHDADLNIVFVNDRRMVTLNTTYLHHRTPTDVLSFPLGETKGRLEGEVYVNLDQARRQAAEYGVKVPEEVARLVIHGLLHLVGYRDGTKRQKDIMTRREEHYLRADGEEGRGDAARMLHQ